MATEPARAGAALEPGGKEGFHLLLAPACTQLIHLAMVDGDWLIIVQFTDAWTGDEKQIYQGK